MIQPEQMVKICCREIQIQDPTCGPNATRSKTLALALRPRYE